jgi:hypothetical protein
MRYFSRRVFLGLTATAVAVFHSPIVLHKLLAAPRRTDPESRWCYWMMENLSANEVLFSIKQHGLYQAQEGILDFFKNFCKRQPETRAWLIARIQAKTPNKDTIFYENIKQRPSSPGEQWYRTVHAKHKYAMNKFGFGTFGDEAFEWHMDLMYRGNHEVQP